MTFGKHTLIFKGRDGTVPGLKFGEIDNHTIQAISCPRRKLSEVSEYLEFKRPRVYFLFENTCTIIEIEHVILLLLLIK